MIPEDLTLDKIKLILTPLEWHEKVELIHLYHTLRSSVDDNHNQYRTSKELGISSSIIYEAILLMRYMSDDLKKLGYREAIKTVQERKRQ